MEMTSSPNATHPAAPITEEVLAKEADAALPPPQVAPEVVFEGLRPGVIDAEWRCEAAVLDENEAPSGDLTQPITVGEKILLTCNGASVPLNRDSLKLDLPKEAVYSLRLLDIRSLSDSSGEFLMTSWAPGKIEFRHVHIADGERRVDLGSLKFEVRSVITSENNPERKPFDQAPPVTMLWPLWVWLSVALAAAFVITVLISLIRKSARRKSLISMLEKHPIAISPYNQFNKDLRRLGRLSVKNSKSDEFDVSSLQSYLRDLNSSFRWYLARELVIPALDIGVSEIIDEVRRIDDRLHHEIKRDLHVVISEIDIALKTQKKLYEEDLYQLTELSRSLADRIHKSKEGRA